MRAVTDAFLRTLKGSHRVAVRARVVTGFQTGSSPVTAATLDPIDGLVTLDGKADARASLHLTVPPTAGWPVFDTDLLAPYGNEIFVERGIWYNATSVEYVPLGYFRIQATDQDNADRGGDQHHRRGPDAGHHRGPAAGPPPIPVGHHVQHHPGGPGVGDLPQRGDQLR